MCLYLRLSSLSERASNLLKLAKQINKSLLVLFVLLIKKEENASRERVRSVRCQSYRIFSNLSMLLFPLSLQREFLFCVQLSYLKHTESMSWWFN